MSTHSAFVLKLKKADAKRTLKNVQGVDINPNHLPYLAVSIHYDGYPSGVGVELRNHIFNYEDALAYVLQGNRQSFVLSYQALSLVDPKHYTYCSPEDDYTVAISDPFNHPFDAEYTYVFKDQSKDGWPRLNLSVIMYADGEEKQLSLDEALAYEKAE